MHAGDGWLKANLDAYATWSLTHNSLLIVTWDEDASKYHKPPPAIPTVPPANQVPLLLVGAMVRAGATSDHPYTHLDLLRTIDDMYGLKPLLGDSKDASDIDGAQNYAEMLPTEGPAALVDRTENPVFAGEKQAVSR